MKKRCLLQTHDSYKNYGGRGITVCERWMKFENFYKDMGDPPERMTLERKNNNKGYSKRNCKWATMKEQSNNTRNNIRITFKNETHTATEWSEKVNLSIQLLLWRLRHGWSIEKTLTTRSNREKV